jgi:hypothetical protein
MMGINAERMLKELCELAGMLAARAGRLSERHPLKELSRISAAFQK